MCRGVDSAYQLEPCSCAVTQEQIAGDACDDCLHLRTEHDHIQASSALPSPSPPPLAELAVGDADGTDEWTASDADVATGASTKRKSTDSAVDARMDEKRQASRTDNEGKPVAHREEAYEDEDDVGEAQIVDKDDDIRTLGECTYMHCTYASAAQWP